ncbi:MAG: YcaO-like family protein, partial [Desulforhopalus sp.]
MNTKTYIVGKDAPLEDTIEKATTLLSDMGLEVEPVSWLNPAPNCWSVHLQASSCHHLYTNGKGTSRQASLASGLGEFFERLSTNYLFSDYYLGYKSKEQRFFYYPDECWFPAELDGGIPQYNSQDIELLNPSLNHYYNPQDELCFNHLVDNNIESENPAICALPFKSLTTDDRTYFPVSILNNLYVSNGMAAGNSVEECCSQALSEIIERYVKNIIISKGISLPDVPVSHLRKYPKLYSILKSLRAHRIMAMVKDASLGGKFPVICVLLADEESGGVFAAFGANCRFEIAIERTLTELLQGRSTEELKKFQPPCHDIELVADPINLESHFVDSDGLLFWNMFADEPDYSFTPWDFTGTSKQEFVRLQNIITQRNFEIFRAEYLHTGIYSCRMVVPGMSEIYPVDDLVWNNRNSGNFIRSLLPKMDRMDIDELIKLLALLESENLNDQQLISHT